PVLNSRVRTGFSENLAANRVGGACVGVMNTSTITTSSPFTAVQLVPAMTGSSDLTLRERSFDDLYRREFPGLVAVATALSGYDGEDLVQDAMVKALVNW